MQALPGRPNSSTPTSSMTAETTVYVVSGVLGAAILPVAFLMLLSVPEALLDPAKAMLWGLHVLFSPIKR